MKLVAPKTLCTTRRVIQLLNEYDGTGFVIGVYNNSMNIQSREGFIINIGHSGHDYIITPRSLIVCFADFYKEILPKLREGSAIEFHNKGIGFPDANLYISTESAYLIDTKIRPFLISNTDRVIKKNLCEALKFDVKASDIISPLSGYFLSRLSFIENPTSDVLQRLQPERRGKPKWDEELKNHMWESIDSFIYLLRTRAWDRLHEGVQSILGLGPGLTPSGDDFIAGFISAGVALSTRPSVRSVTERLAWVIAQESKNRTTCISYNMLEDAANGDISIPAIHFIESVLLASDLDKVKLFARRLCSIGASSGEDLCNGIATGIWFFEKMSICRYFASSKNEVQRLPEVGK